MLKCNLCQGRQLSVDLKVIYFDAGKKDNYFHHSNIHYLAKSHHLDLTNQIGLSLLLDCYCMNNCRPDNKIFNPSWCNE